MGYLFLSDTIEMVGHLLIAYTVIMVHYRFWREHKIDTRVFLEMKRERTLGILGIAFMLAGYFMRIVFVV